MRRRLDNGATPTSKSSSRRASLDAAKYIGWAALLAAFGITCYGTDVEPYTLDVTRVRIALSRLPRAFDGLTIAQISDIHLGEFTRIEKVTSAVDALLALKPDIVVVTGDHVSRFSRREAQMIMDELSRLTAPLGVFAIMGNHDHWTNPEGVHEALRNAGLTVLRNSNVSIERAGQKLYVVGVDDVWEKQDDLPLALSRVPDEAFAILLIHEPDFADEASKDQRIALQISGHSHGGQFRLPGLGTVYRPYLARKYPDGLFKVGKMSLYVNRGIGMVLPPVRINCPPEVTLLELVTG